MNIYNRPFDDQSQIRIKLETVAVFDLLEGMTKGKYYILWSFILDYENSLNPYDDIRFEIKKISRFASEKIIPDESIREQAKIYELHGVKPRDALHLACAELSGAAYFITCDDKLLKKQKIIQTRVTMMNPIDFILHLEETDHATT